MTEPATVRELMQVLSDPYSMKIISATTDKSKSVEEISKENEIPLSTCYRRVHEMLEGGVLLVDRIVVTAEGKKFELLRSAYKGFSITFENGAVGVDGVVNEDVADKLHRLWISMRG